MNENLKNQLAEIEQRGNYLEMSNVLIFNPAPLTNDAECALYALKCVVHGGLSVGNNVKIITQFGMTEQNEAEGNILDRSVARKSNNAREIGKRGIITLTNSYFINAIQTVITYGNSEMIGQAAKIICPLYSPIGEMLKNKCFVSYDTYSCVASIMCELGNMIADGVTNTNKANFPGSKDIIGGFAEFVMTPLKAYLGGFFGLLIGSSVSSTIKNQVKNTYAKMVSMA